MDTVPPEQLLTIRRQMEVTEFRTVSKPVGKRTNDDNVWPMTKADITTLVKYAVETNCVVCDGKQKCQLRDMLDDLPVDIENDWFMSCRGGGI